VAIVIPIIIAILLIVIFGIIFLFWRRRERTLEVQFLEEQANRVQEPPSQSEIETHAVTAPKVVSRGPSFRDNDDVFGSFRPGSNLLHEVNLPHLNLIVSRLHKKKVLLYSNLFSAVSPIQFQRKTCISLDGSVIFPGKKRRLN